MVIIQHNYNVSTNSHSGTKLHSFPEFRAEIILFIVVWLLLFQVEVSRTQNPNPTNECCNVFQRLRSCSCSNCLSLQFDQDVIWFWIDSNPTELASLFFEPNHKSWKEYCLPDDCEFPTLSGDWVQRNLVKMANRSVEHLQSRMDELDIGFKDISWSTKELRAFHYHWTASYI